MSFSDKALFPTEKEYHNIMFVWRNKKKKKKIPELPLLFRFVCLRTGRLWFDPQQSRTLLYFICLRHFQQFFSHIVTMCGCDKEYNAHFRVLPHWNILLQKHCLIFHPSTLYWLLADLFWFLGLLLSQLAFYVNLHRAVIGPSATLTGRWRPDIDLRRMLTGRLLL